MLSYRHSFHAGNPADVLKHLVLAQVLGYQTIKDKPLDYIDTHSGAGFFELAAPDAQKTQEYQDGIEKLWQHTSQHSALNDYIELIKSFNESASLAFYPGSPKIAEHFLRRQDKGWFFELHPRDLVLLKENMQGKRSIRVRGENGFAGLIGLLPPASRRACVLIDPPYEIKDDYNTVVQTIVKAHQRFATGTYMIWYPNMKATLLRQLEDLEQLDEETLRERGGGNRQHVFAKRHTEGGGNQQHPPGLGAGRRLRTRGRRPRG